MWQIPPDKLVLAQHETYVWRANLNLTTAEITQLTEILAEDERIKADQFRFAQHQQRYVAARGILRKILGCYLNLSGDAIQFEYNSRGKPEIADSLNAINLQFNVSHSQDFALYGITCDRRIGIDLEYLRDLDDADKIARRFFAPTESALVASLTGDEQKRVFFQFWTAKEAYLKAIGSGLAGGLDTVEIALKPQAIALLAVGETSENHANWSLVPFIPQPNYIATLATETKQQPQQIKFFTWDKTTLKQ
ncbi:MAG: 4'-phosphopantetheinyl transferase family protein [Pleurocapsa sp.]